MATKVQCKSYSPGYYSMRDSNELSNSGSWSRYYGDNTMPNGQYQNGFLPKTVADIYTGYSKDVVKQTMLEHEAIFRNQVYELHRLYRTQRDLMDEVRTKELHKHHVPVEPLLSANSIASQMPTEDPWKWQLPMFGGPSSSNADNNSSPSSFIKEKSAQMSPMASQCGGRPKDCEILGSRPSKVRRKMFDLQLPADEYIDSEETSNINDENLPNLMSCAPENYKIASRNSTRLFLGSSGKADFEGNASGDDTCLRRSRDLADLNDPIQLEDTNPVSTDFLRCVSSGGQLQVKETSSLKSKNVGLPNGSIQKFQYECDTRMMNHQLHDSRLNGGVDPSCMLEAGQSESNQRQICQGPPQRFLNLPSKPSNMLNKAVMLPNDRSTIDYWRENSSYGLEFSKRSHGLSSHNNSASLAVSQMNNSLPLHSSDSRNYSFYSAVTREKPNISICQPMVAQKCSNSSPALNYMTEPSAKFHQVTGQRYHIEKNPELSLVSGNIRNGFSHGSSSKSKEQALHYPFVGFEYKSSKKSDIALDQFALHVPGRYISGSSCGNSEKDMNCTNLGIPSEHSVNNGAANYVNRSSYKEAKAGKELTWNMMLSSSNGVVPQKGSEVLNGGRKREDHGALLPWMTAKAAVKNEPSYSGRDLNTSDASFYRTAADRWSKETESKKDPKQTCTQNIPSASSVCDDELKRYQNASNLNAKKILGVPIFETACVYKNESFSFTSPPGSTVLPLAGDGLNNNKTSGIPDINLASDHTGSEFGGLQAADDLVLKQGTEAASLRGKIDLNLCISEDEALCAASVPTHVVSGIDLEAPAPTETEEEILAGRPFPTEEYMGEKSEKYLSMPGERAEEPFDNLDRVAAEAIVVMSSSRDQNDFETTLYNEQVTPLTSSLDWFVEVAFSCWEDLGNKFGAVSRAKNGRDHGESSFRGPRGMDYFEAMTLKLRETDMEEYQCKPQNLDPPKAEDKGIAVLASRPRKGQGRRGRQRRDFQRDILPGLASLSRHEVTEDLQTFGGLMKAMGHSWQSGPTRRNATRNGCGRGRRRLVASPTPAAVASPIPAAVASPFSTTIHQLSNVEVGLEERSLAGWGKTTRRPRRQRCPPGNSPSVALA